LIDIIAKEEDIGIIKREMSDLTFKAPSVLFLSTHQVMETNVLNNSDNRLINTGLYAGVLLDMRLLCLFTVQLVEARTGDRVLIHVTE